MSLKLPPVFPLTFIRSKLTSFLSKSATDNTAFTAISAIFYLSLLTTFEPNEVFADSIKFKWLSENISISSEIFSIVFKQISQAFSNPSAIFNGCRPLSIKKWAYSNKAPANTTTPVVPSPISSS